MKLFFHYCSIGFSNSYVIGTDLSADTREPSVLSPEYEPPVREAVIIDPGNMDLDILNLVENNNYKLRAVLITHDHLNHVQGLKTIMRIYDTEVFAVNPVVSEHHTTLVRDGDIITIGPFRTEVISIPGHSADSAVYKIDRLLFTGDALSAGLIGTTASSYAAATQVTALRSKLLSLPGDYTILPGHGPPSTLEAERRFNLGLNSFESQKSRRESFRVSF
ncbi:MAG: MBL fold metallo-hydrolase [Treponema sp.]|nr:MBL fold metallo-hydrolase [Treponema sp.]